LPSRQIVYQTPDTARTSPQKGASCRESVAR
jgi:hypothetical protein